MGTGTELGLCVSAFEKLKSEGIRARVVSMPSWEISRASLSLPRQCFPAATVARVSVEAAGTFGWNKYVGEHGATVGMKTFGASAPLAELSKKFGFSTEAVVAGGQAQIDRVKSAK